MDLLGGIHPLRLDSALSMQSMGSLGSMQLQHQHQQQKLKKEKKVQADPDASFANEGEVKKRRAAKRKAHVFFAGLKFGNWNYPSADGQDAAKGTCEARITFSLGQGVGKVSYEIPFASEEHPEANKALIEFTFPTITAVEVDEEGSCISFLLSAPPATYVGKTVMVHKPEEGNEPVPTSHWQPVQYDFSKGPIKTNRAHTLFLGAGDMSLPNSGGGRAGRGGGRGGRGGRSAPNMSVPGWAVRRLVESMSQDEAMAEIIEQGRQALPGGNFPSFDVEASVRAEGKKRGRKPGGGANANNEGPPTTVKRPYVRKNKPKAEGEGDGPGGSGGKEDAPGNLMSQLMTPMASAPSNTLLPAPAPLQLGLPPQQVSPAFAGLLGNLSTATDLAAAAAAAARAQGMQGLG